MNKLAKIAIPTLVATGVGIGVAYTLKRLCNVKVPKGVHVVQNFDINSYTGQWYEVARFNFKYERDLKNVTANYSLNKDGSVRVVNKGYNYVKNEWEEAIGKARFVGDPTQGALKVSFFGPFYSGYNIVMMDPDYENVLVFGKNTDYIWFLSRHKTISAEVKNKFIEKAREAGYDINRLIWTAQE